MNIEIANRLVELRKKNNLSQEALAEKLGISRQAVSKWERAEASPDTDNLILLARLYGVSLDELLRTEEEVAAPDNIVSEEQPVRIIEEHKKIDYRSLQKFPLLFVVTFFYVIMGAVWGGWHPGWLMFFLPILWHSGIQAVKKKDARHFAYPVLVTFVYLCLGFFCSLWHPGWIVFFTVPLYYPLVNYFRRLYQRQNAELDGIMGQAAENTGKNSR